jgi:Phage integrase family
MFEQLAYLAGLPPIRLHDLRHGAATLLLAAGHDMKVVQETLGLSSITIAADTYTSVPPQLARQSAEDVAALIRPATTPARAHRAMARTGKQAHQAKTGADLAGIASAAKPQSGHWLLIAPSAYPAGVRVFPANIADPRH